MKSYRELLNISEKGGTIPLFTKNSNLKEAICTGYQRVVIGQRGPYIEFKKTHIFDRKLYIPTKQLYRLSDPKVYYIEFRTVDDDVKVYYQMRTVAYADYKIEHFYISPLDLKTEFDIPCMIDSVTCHENAKEFFQFD